MKKIFTGTFYPLAYGEIIKGFDHYNYKLPLTKHFDLKFFCYNSSENKTEIIRRKENDLNMQIFRFNEQSDDFSVITQFFNNIWKPDICNFHGGNSGQKGTARKLIEYYKNSNIKFGLEYGGGFDKQSMMAHYYNERANYVILNHELWRTFFPDDYQSKIFITPKNQSVNTSIFHSIAVQTDNNQFYDIITVGRYDGGNKGHNTLYSVFNNTDIRVLLKGNDIPNNLKSKNIFIEQAEYDHYKMNLIYNSAKIFIWGTKQSIENPFCTHVRVITEAMACGLPIIGFKDSFKESNLVYNEQNGFLVDSEEDLLEKTRLLLNDKELYYKMSQKSLEIAQDCKIKNFLKFYKELWENI